MARRIDNPLFRLPAGLVVGLTVALVIALAIVVGVGEPVPAAPAAVGPDTHPPPPYQDAQRRLDRRDRGADTEVALQVHREVRGRGPAGPARREAGGHAVLEDVDEATRAAEAGPGLLRLASPAQEAPPHTG